MSGSIPIPMLVAIFVVALVMFGPFGDGPTTPGTVRTSVGIAARDVMGSSQRLPHAPEAAMVVLTSVLHIVRYVPCRIMASPLCPRRSR
jgi:hypothetical protein